MPSHRKAHMPGSGRGFSLIELMVVVAIMAIVAGLTFPVAATLRERGNQTACSGNLQNIGQSLRMYRLDERGYPPALLGYLEEGKDDPTTFLYPHYIRSTRDFKCPNNPVVREDLYTRVFQPGSLNPQSGVPLKRVSTGRNAWTLEPVTDRNIVYFAFDSYDGGYTPPKPMPDPATYTLYYRRDWASIAGDSTMYDRELLNRNPEDRTFVTTCSYHRRYTGTNIARGSQDIVLFQDGHVEKRPSVEVDAMGWKIEPRS